MKCMKHFFETMLLDMFYVNIYLLNESLKLVASMPMRIIKGPASFKKYYNAQTYCINVLIFIHGDRLLPLIFWSALSKKAAGVHRRPVTPPVNDCCTQVTSVAKLSISFTY